MEALAGSLKSFAGKKSPGND